MAEWKLFDRDLPEPPDLLAGRGWMDLEHQPGFAQRAAMVTGLARLVLGLMPYGTTVTDLGCGDGAMLGMLGLGKRAWGYELGAGDVLVAGSRGLDVRQADILAGDLEYGDVLIASEVLEHLADPAAFLAAIPFRLLPSLRLLIASSPSAETGDWHNAIHAWAWDLEGYRGLLERSGYEVLYQAECDGGRNCFGGVTGEQRFQAIVAVRQ